MADQNDLKMLTTYELSFNLAMKKYTPEDVLIALDIIYEREHKGSKSSKPDNTPSNNNNGKVGVVSEPVKLKAPLEGSKASKIYNLIAAGKTAKDVFNSMNKGGKTVVYYPEIYRIGKKYFPERFGS